MQFKIKKITICVILSMLNQAWALPTGGTFNQGTGSIVNGSLKTDITLTGTNAKNGVLIDWAGFNVLTGETVNFFNSTSKNGVTVVNQDNSGSLSSIAGTINAGGLNLLILNPNGVNISNSALISSASLFADTATANAKATGEVVITKGGSGQVDVASGANIQANLASSTFNVCPDCSVQYVSAGGDLPYVSKDVKLSIQNPGNVSTTSAGGITVGSNAGQSFNIKTVGNYYFNGAQLVLTGSASSGTFNIYNPKGTVELNNLKLGSGGVLTGRPQVTVDPATGAIDVVTGGTGDPAKSAYVKLLGSFNADGNLDTSVSNLVINGVETQNLSSIDGFAKNVNLTGTNKSLNTKLDAKTVTLGTFSANGGKQYAGLVEGQTVISGGGVVNIKADTMTTSGGSMAISGDQRVDITLNQASSLDNFSVHLDDGTVIVRPLADLTIDGLTMTGYYSTENKRGDNRFYVQGIREGAITNNTGVKTQLTIANSSIDSVLTRIDNGSVDTTKAGFGGISGVTLNNVQINQGGNDFQGITIVPLNSVTMTNTTMAGHGTDNPTGRVYVSTSDRTATDNTITLTDSHLTGKLTIIGGGYGDTANKDITDISGNCISLQSCLSGADTSGNWWETFDWNAILNGANAQGQQLSYNPADGVYDQSRRTHIVNLNNSSVKGTSTVWVGGIDEVNVSENSLVEALNTQGAGVTSIKAKNIDWLATGKGDADQHNYWSAETEHFYGGFKYGTPDWEKSDTTGHANIQSKNVRMNGTIKAGHNDSHTPPQTNPDPKTNPNNCNVGSSCGNGGGGGQTTTTPVTVPPKTPEDFCATHPSSCNTSTPGTTVINTKPDSPISTPPGTIVKTPTGNPFEIDPTGNPVPVPPNTPPTVIVPPGTILKPTPTSPPIVVGPTGEPIKVPGTKTGDIVTDGVGNPYVIDTTGAPRPIPGIVYPSGTTPPGIYTPGKGWTPVTVTTTPWVPPAGTVTTTPTGIPLVLYPDGTWRVPVGTPVPVGPIQVVKTPTGVWIVKDPDPTLPFDPPIKGPEGDPITVFIDKDDILTTYKDVQIDKTKIVKVKTGLGETEAESEEWNVSEVETFENGKKINNRHNQNKGKSKQKLTRKL